MAHVDLTTFVDTSKSKGTWLNDDDLFQPHILTLSAKGDYVTLNGPVVPPGVSK